jgi:hypothetical protein
MKTMLSLLVIIVFLAILPVKGAVVVVPNPTEEEFYQIYSTGLFSWSVLFETAYPTANTPEMRVITNHVESRDLIWSTPEVIGIDYDIPGNLYVRAGSTTITVQPTEDFNMVLIRLGDRARFSTYTEFKTATFDGTAIRNMFADDGNTRIMNNDYQIISNVGDTFEFNGSFFKSPASVGTESQLEIIGVYFVPEPSSVILFVSSALFLCIRRR